MKRAIAIAFCSLLVGLVCAAGVDSQTGPWREDAQLRAMRDELARSKALKLNDLDTPYFIQYVSDDAEQMTITASLGGLVRANRFRLRRPNAEVRVGSYAFDNTNSVYTANMRFGLFPLDDDYQALRTSLWRTTDVLYKAATGEITAKRNALREISDPDKTPDLAPAKPVQVLEPVEKLDIDQAAWQETLKNVSGEFVAHPSVLTSSVRLQTIASTYRLVNSEGTVVRIPETLNEIEIRASGRAPDGQRVWNHAFVVAPEPKQFPTQDRLAKLVDTVATQTEALMKAPLAEDYSGPVIFEQEAAAQMIAQVMTDAVTLRRRPIAPPGSDGAGAEILDSVWSTRMGSKVLPEWMSVFDDPLQQSYRDVDLAGHYRVDDEGVPAQRVSLVDKGTLRGFLLSREPVRNFSGSNGHGRLPGSFGSEQAVIGNLFVETAHPVPEARLKAQLLEKVKAAGLKYGLILRSLDFPSTATLGELQSMARQLQKSGSVRTVNQPLLAYRVYPDGREELVRGLRFREFSAKDLRDVDAASDKPYVLNFVNDGSGLNIADLRNEATTSSVICPSLLLDSVELTRAENEADVPPIVPPPALVAAR